MKPGDKAIYIGEMSAYSLGWWPSFYLAAILLALLLCGCAARKPAIGAPPHWKQDTPFGGHWECDGPYEYNPQTQHCEATMSYGAQCCNHCGAAMEEFMQTNSGRMVYKCPDCWRKQFHDGGVVPTDLILKPLEQSDRKP